MFNGWHADAITADSIRAYQLRRRAESAEAATVNRETSTLSRMLKLAVTRGQLDRLPTFPNRLQENPPRDGFFEHAEYLDVRVHLPASYQDVLDFAYYSGWRRNEILHLTWSEVDLVGGVVRLTPRRSKTRTGRVLPISTPLRAVLDRRVARRQPNNPRVFLRDGVPVRTWRTALREAGRQAHVPHRLLHDCRRTAARNLIRAGVPERVAMLLTGHKTRAIFDRYNIVNEQELLTAGERLATYVAGQ
jgi:integrase